MSRHSYQYYTEDSKFEVAFGHDKVSGYFLQIFDLTYEDNDEFDDIPVVDESEFVSCGFMTFKRNILNGTDFADVLEGLNLPEMYRPFTELMRENPKTEFMTWGWIPDEIPDWNHDLRIHKANSVIPLTFVEG